MSNPSFVQRFKNKSDTLSIDGIPKINPNSAVSKPSDSQVHNSIIRTSANIMLKKSASPQPADRLLNQDSEDSELYFHAKSSILNPKSPQLGTKNAKSPKNWQKKIGKNQDSEVNRSNDKREYRPYTLKEYHNVKPSTYYQLGGLGPANIGTEEWLKQKGLKERRLNYGLNVYYINAAKLPLIPVSRATEKSESSREKANKFAALIRKPPLRKSISPE